MGTSSLIFVYRFEFKTKDTKMKLSKIAILALKGLAKEDKGRIAGSIGASTNSFYRWLKENAENGELTKARALQVIEEETGLNQSEILEKSVAAA